jgi:Rrf2 family nitric oxide-sensitive transcriptional repressor
MFTQTVEYALRAMVCLASRPEEPQSNSQIAATTKVPSAYLSKVLQKLAKAELVHSQRGVQGGFVLAHSAAEISILQIVSAVDPIERIRSCPLGLAAHGVRLCPLHKKMDQALAQVESAFASTTLAEILAEPSGSVPLCDFPRPRCAAVELPG